MSQTTNCTYCLRTDHALYYKDHLAPYSQNTHTQANSINAFKATGSPRDTFRTMTDVFSYWSSYIFHTIFVYVFEQNQTYLEISFSSTQMHLYSPSLHRSRMTLYLRRFIRLINFYNRILALPPASLISKIYSSCFYNQ